ncbi:MULTISPECIES: YdcF family protein [Pontibacillus]|uniref:YdcF family protein n=1 Tax=Pontibacillus chungwhensis TaxID=265426 RepID=A0ABY8UYR7_9BACI|nr:MULTISPECIES: YdcF family protein [Pontibacillus]MCD5325279.1 YdcF family protein [Pontibacillus sp. HN14]WIF97524.1 YdcF family protein [Pontibacillus chungwhensis]
MKRLLTLLFWVGILYVGYIGYSIWTFEGDRPLESTDAAVVLGAAAYYDKPSPVLKERVNHAVKLYKDGKVDHVILTGGKGEGAPFAESEVARDYAVEKGVPKEDTFVDLTSKITEGNIINAKLIGEEQGFKDYTLVSDPLHMKRSMAIANQINLDAVASPTETSAYQSLETRVPFFLREWAFYFLYKGSLIVPDSLKPDDWVPVNR